MVQAVQRLASAGASSARSMRRPQLRSHRAQRAALGLGDMDLARPALGIVYVSVLPRDVHVAENRELRGSRQELLHPARERLVPAQLVRVLLRAGRLAVGRVEAQDANAAYGSRDAALRVVGEVGDAVRDITDRRAREDGDAVIGALAAIHGVIAGVAQLSDREIRVLGLRLLQAGDIRLRVA